MDKPPPVEPSLPKAGRKELPTSQFESLLDSEPSVASPEGDETIATPRRRTSDPGPEASIILIAHPQDRMLGARYRFRPGSSLILGRGESTDIRLADISSVSRRHARLRYQSQTVSLEDLGSTNGTHVNDRRIEEQTVLRSGDRFQIGAVHFKFLQERDIENAYHRAIHDLVVRDGLTQIANKRRFEEEADREVGRARRYGRPLSLILFDLDHFKLVNDTHGHLCGDFVLKEIVRVTRSLMRREQVFARVGGEEFAILTPEARIKGAQVLAERVRTKIARHELRHREASFHVTCSFGVAELEAEMKSPQDLYEAADQALYRSKKAGRNRVTVFSAG